MFQCISSLWDLQFLQSQPFIETGRHWIFSIWCESTFTYCQISDTGSPRCLWLSFGSPRKAFCACVHASHCCFYPKKSYPNPKGTNLTLPNNLTNLQPYKLCQSLPGLQYCPLSHKYRILKHCLSRSPISTRAMLFTGMQLQKMLWQRDTLWAKGQPWWFSQSCLWARGSWRAEDPCWGCKSLILSLCFIVLASYLSLPMVGPLEVNWNINNSQTDPFY